jgi:3'-phosphoadenosine 5'-phosphosulfate sulfotransferase (PAPS reductase)/FAD synthetase
MNELIRQSKEIYDVAVSTYKPKTTVLMLSGGDDSMTAYYVAKELGVKFDFAIHGNTRTGIEETTEFAISEIEKNGDKLLLADAGDSYIKYIVRKGFFGKGNHAHNFSYHILKWTHFRRVVSQHIRKRRKNFPILFINGARQSESERRKVTMVSPYKQIGGGSNIWVNIINHWDRHHCLDYLEGNGIKRNPVSILLCRSGECMCGTMQTEGDRQEASFHFPRFKERIDVIDSVISKLHGWGWNDSMPKGKVLLAPKIITDVSQVMCTGCKVNYNEHAELQKNITLGL